MAGKERGSGLAYEPVWNNTHLQPGVTTLRLLIALRVGIRAWSLQGLPFVQALDVQRYTFIRDTSVSAC